MHNIKENHFSISIATVQSQSGSLVNNKPMFLCSIHIIRLVTDSGVSIQISTDYSFCARHIKIHFPNYKNLIVKVALFSTSQIPPILPEHRVSDFLILLILSAHCVSCVARTYSGIPPMDNE
jgi:hypothetical protein